METIELILSLVMVFLVVFGLVVLISIIGLLWAKKRREKHFKHWYYKVGNNKKLSD